MMALFLVSGPRNG